MSKATKRKHVTREVLDEYMLPKEDQSIVKVVSSKGNNLHEVETEKGEKFLVSMPSKFRKNVWIKRGDFILVEPIEEGDKVKAEIVTILYRHQIKYIQEEGQWPAAFTEEGMANQDSMIPDDMLPPSDEDSDCEYDADRVVNANRPKVVLCESDDSSEDGDKAEAQTTDRNECEDKT